MAASAKRFEHDCYVQGLARPTAALRRPQGPSTSRMLTCPQASNARNSMAECRTFLLAVGLRAELRLADKWKVPGRAKPYCVTNLRCHSGAQPNRLGRFSCEPGIHNPRRLRQPQPTTTAFIPSARPVVMGSGLRSRSQCSDGAERRSEWSRPRNDNAQNFVTQYH